MSDNYIIQAKDVQKYYNGGEIKALDGVTASVRKGEVVVIIGPSGSGKSKTPISISTGRKWEWCSSILTCSLI